MGYILEGSAEGWLKDWKQELKKKKKKGQLLYLELRQLDDGCHSLR